MIHSYHFFTIVLYIADSASTNVNMSQMQISIAKMVIGSILSPNAMLILILYVPMVVVLLWLQNQVIRSITEQS